MCFLWSLYFQLEHKLAGNKRSWAHDLLSVTGSVRKAPSSTQLTGHAGWKRRASGTCTCTRTRTHLFSLLEKLGGAETSLNICLQIASGFSFKSRFTWFTYHPLESMAAIRRHAANCQNPFQDQKAEMTATARHPESHSILPQAVSQCPGVPSGVAG